MTLSKLKSLSHWGSLKVVGARVPVSLVLLDMTWSSVFSRNGRLWPLLPQGFHPVLRTGSRCSTKPWRPCTFKIFYFDLTAFEEVERPGGLPGITA